MQYVSQSEIQSMQRVLGGQKDAIRAHAMVKHAGSVSRRDAARLVVISVLCTVMCTALYIRVRMYAMQLVFGTELAWYESAYSKSHQTTSVRFTMQHVCMTVEYTAFSDLTTSFGVWPTLPRSSALFLVTMVQHYHNDLTLAHWSGSRAQLNASMFRDFIKDWRSWDTPKNPWRFLFPNQSMFMLSAAIKTARSLPDGGSMLQRLYEGGLCLVAIEFYTPERSSTEMCRLLLDTQLVYYQECRAARLAQSLSQGTDVASTIAMAAGTAATVVGAAAGYGIGLAKTIVSAMAVCAGTGPAYVFCVMGVFVVVAAAFAVTVAVATAVFYSQSKCPTGQYYTLTEREDGTIAKVEWDGDASRLPKNKKK